MWCEKFVSRLVPDKSPDHPPKLESCFVPSATNTHTQPAGGSHPLPESPRAALYLIISLALRYYSYPNENFRTLVKNAEKKSRIRRTRDFFVLPSWLEGGLARGDRGEGGEIVQIGRQERLPPVRSSRYSLSSHRITQSRGGKKSHFVSVPMQFDPEQLNPSWVVHPLFKLSSPVFFQGPAILLASSCPSPYLILLIPLPCPPCPHPFCPILLSLGLLSSSQL